MCACVCVYAHSAYMYVFVCAVVVMHCLVYRCFFVLALMRSMHTVRTCRERGREGAEADVASGVDVDVDAGIGRQRPLRILLLPPTEITVMQVSLGAPFEFEASPPHG